MTSQLGTKLASGMRFDAEQLCTYARNIHPFPHVNVFDMAYVVLFLHFIASIRQQLVTAQP